MTNNEINLQIAKKLQKRLKRLKIHGYKCTNGKDVYILKGPLADGYEFVLVDYINDPALNRELELELMERGWLPIIYHIGKRGKYGYANSLCYGPSNDDFGKATCLAWIEEFGND